MGRHLSPLAGPSWFPFPGSKPPAGAREPAVAAAAKSSGPAWAAKKRADLPRNLNSPPHRTGARDSRSRSSLKREARGEDDP
ncbi:unnamed protein product [Merluccius merluccius]